jgi:hypothetical protein
MYNKEQEILLNKFAELNDKLFNLGITSTDSFTGEIGEYIVCKHFNLDKTARVTRAVDGICKLGNKYQVKAKVVSKNNFSYSITKLDTTAFHYLAIVYFDRQYNPIKILRIPSSKIKDGQIRITSAILNSDIETIEKAEIKIPVTEKNAINEFAKVYEELEQNGIIRSRRIVGDIGEFYACKHLDLQQSENRNEKGIDARNKDGLTFEIKTRRVYTSDRRINETRRLNNLVGKTADYLIVVTIDKSFKCSGMWIIPMINILNPKSANLKIVNTTIGTKNLIPSKINWLTSGEKFISFENKKAKKIVVQSKNKTEKIPLIRAEELKEKKQTTVTNRKKTIKNIPIVKIEKHREITENKNSKLSKSNFMSYVILIIGIIYVICLILSLT